MRKLELLLGHKKYMLIKQFVKYMRDTAYFLFHSKVQVINPNIELSVFGEKGKHIFFGYYDIQQLNNSEDKALVHIVNKKANTKTDKSEIGYYNINNKTYKKIADTHTWNWQQGSRLRWWPTDDNFISYNDLLNDQYVCKKINLKTKKVDAIYNRALYDIDSKGTYGLSLNFSRLQRLRPGYGYDLLEDDTKNISAPEDDGIYYVDLLKNKSQLIVNLKSLAEKCHDENAKEHYINHISISPDGEKFIFFHIWTLKDSCKWKTNLYVSNKKGTKLLLLEKEDMVSHYDWVDSENVLITSYTKDGKQIYSIYNINNAVKRILPTQFLNKDGHPTIKKNHEEFISDTYPKKMDLQELFNYNISNNKKQTLMYIYSSPLMYEEKRCDLHPRVSKSEKIISIDSTFKNNCKNLIIIKNKTRN